MRYYLLDRGGRVSVVGSDGVRTELGAALAAHCASCGADPGEYVVLVRARASLVSKSVGVARRALASAVVAEPLTRREREVLGHVVAGMTNKEIGARLGVGERTVKFHVGGLMRKYGVRARMELARKCAWAGRA